MSLPGAAQRLACHCGAVKIAAILSDGLETAQRCDCSFCRRRGAIVVSAPLAGLRIVRGSEQLTLYKWGTGTAKHYFRSVCGIYTHHQRRSDPNEYAVNVACIDGIDPRDLDLVQWADGVNHPSDRLDGAT